ncbi:MAG TPA: NUDIX hydrolase [Chloroflexota bacterium]|nr:NUDIX hydrolase [Chloroflexota bacterium]
MPGWKRLASRLVLDRSPWLRVFEEDVLLPNGTVLPHFLRLESADFAAVFAVTHDENAVVIQEYKYGADRVSWALPAGLIEPSETPEAGARRELLEETGYVARTWTALGAFVEDGNRGLSTGHFFLARGAQRAQAPQQTAQEHTVAHLVPVARARELLSADYVAGITTVAVIGLALNRLSTEF